MTARDEAIEAAARALFEVENPTYSETACADHNRWSWLGDGHPEEFKDRYRTDAAAALSWPGCPRAQRGDTVSDELTDYGFTFGALEVTRPASMPDGSVCLRVSTATQRIEVYASPAGRSLRVFTPGGTEWKPAGSGGADPKETRE